MTTLLAIDSVFMRDFGKLELLSSFLSLDFEMYTTSTACYDMEMPAEFVTYDSKVSGKLYVGTLTCEELDKAFALGAAFPGLSYLDYTVLYVARRDHLELITGDSRVSAVASSMHIVVHDYLWAMEEMIKAGRLDATRAIVKYYQLETSVNRFAIMEDPVVALQNAYRQRQQTA